MFIFSLQMGKLYLVLINRISMNIVVNLTMPFYKTGLKEILKSVL